MKEGKNKINIEKNNKKKYIYLLVFWGLLSSIFVIVATVCELNTDNPNLPEFYINIAIGIFCSVIASIIFCLFQAAIEKDEKTGVERIIDELDQIDVKLKKQVKLYDKGIVSIHPKSYYDKEGAFWKGIIENSNERLDLIGHSIHKWFEPEYKEIFVKKIKELAEKGKKVRIVLSGKKPDMGKIHETEKSARNKQELTKIENTCIEIRKIVKKLNASKKDNIDLYVVDLTKVTYLYIRTDSALYLPIYIA